MQKRTRELFGEISAVQRTFVESGVTVASVARAAGLVVDALKGGHKVLLCGNGGSAADCQHIAGEFVGRFRRERAAWPAVALTTDTSILTAIGNDYSYDDIFKRQVEALGCSGDVLVAYTTSGNSPNVLRAAGEAKARGMSVIGLTGEGGGKLKALADVLVEAPTKSTARAQECHEVAGHVICELVEAALTDATPAHA